MATTEAKNYFYILNEIKCYKCKRHLINTPKGVYFKDIKGKFVFDKEFNKKYRLLQKLGAKLSCTCCFKFEEVIKFHVKLDVDKSEFQGPYFFCGPFGLLGLISINKRMNSDEELKHDIEKFKTFINKYNRIFFKKYSNLKYKNKVIDLTNKIYSQSYLFGAEDKIRREQHKMFINYMINLLNRHFDRQIFYADKNHKIIDEIKALDEFDSKYDWNVINSDYIKYNLVNIVNNNFKQKITVEFPVKGNFYSKDKIINPYFLIKINLCDDKNKWSISWSKSVNLKEENNNQCILNEREAEMFTQGLVWITSLCPIY